MVKVSYDKKETTKVCVPVSEVVNENKPSSLVELPSYVPCKYTFATEIGMPFWSVTLPSILVCAKFMVVIKRNVMVKSDFILLVFWLIMMPQNCKCSTMNKIITYRVVKNEG